MLKKQFMKQFYVCLILLFLTLFSSAREGMWIPLLLDKNIDEMQQMGFTLSASDIYDINNSSMKDAVVLFGYGCTGEIISPGGLLITNHHCGFGQIQSHSSVENDYLSNGFWAMSRDEELPNKDLTVTFLVEMRDVTSQVLFNTDTIFNLSEKQKIIDQNIQHLTDTVVDGTHYEAQIKPLYYGNKYYMYITEKYLDVRLVGAPPSAIGKFGGDTDNWMWPRHTGDFALFRIYADSLNNPAPYSESNVPYTPKKYFPINISGIDEGDFTMIFGYPGTTQQYLYSDAVRQLVNHRNPNRIDIRNIKLDILREAMNNNPRTRIQYAAKYASASNAWKKWQGETRGLKRLDAVNVKLHDEEDFQNWLKLSKSQTAKYQNVLSRFDSLYTLIEPFQSAKDYYDEIVFRGADAYKMYGHLNSVLHEASDFSLEKTTDFMESYFKDYNESVDREVFSALINKLYSDVDSTLLPAHFLSYFDGKNPISEIGKIYQNSLFANNTKLKKIIKANDYENLTKQIRGDNLYQFYNSLVTFYYATILDRYLELSKQIGDNQKKYMAGILEMRSGENMYPDANLTLRVSYGKVEGYYPADGVYYSHYTTLDGIIEKDNPDIYDYRVPDKLKQLYYNSDYGNYANSNGELSVCFIASNHTTGGNSGSPVLNKHGHLVGINFDRCWEGTMSDIMFDPEKCRNISLDMRYMLFLVDKFAGADYLINEMEIIR